MLKAPSQLQHLKDQIVKKREEMIVIAKETGYISHQTVTCSQELDQIILEIQKINQTGRDCVDK